jgi:uncharacterized protein
MIKIIVVIAILFIIYIAFFKKKAIQEEKKSSKKKSDSGDIMIECSECSTFVSENDAIIKDGKFFCTKECAKLR